MEKSFFVPKSNFLMKENLQVAFTQDRTVDLWIMSPTCYPLRQNNEFWTKNLSGHGTFKISVEFHQNQSGGNIQTIKISKL